MNIVEAINSKPEKISRKLSNGLTEVKEFHSNDQICAHYFLDENGKKHGEYKSWWSNGTLCIHRYFENDKRRGEYKQWLANGTLLKHCYIKNGKLHGEYKSWWSNRTLCKHCYYEHGKLHG